MIQRSSLLVDTLGWEQAFLTVVAMALVSALLSLSLWRMRFPSLVREGAL